MANSFKYKDVEYKVGDTVAINYKIKEGDKERLQLFKGILIKITGNDDATRSFTVRKVTRSGIGVERIIPASSPYISTMTLVKKSSFEKAKLYFIRRMTEQEVRSKLYQSKKTATKKAKKTTTISK